MSPLKAISFGFLKIFVYFMCYVAMFPFFFAYITIED